MTGASEQGRDGLLWTIFEGEPFCSRRIASFGLEQEAREYLLSKQGHTGTVSSIAHMREERDDAFQRGYESAEALRKQLIEAQGHNSKLQAVVDAARTSRQMHQETRSLELLDAALSTLETDNTAEFTREMQLNMMHYLTASSPSQIGKAILAVEQDRNKLRAERDELQQQLDDAWENRNRFCEHINVIGHEVLKSKAENCAPDAVSRETKKLVEQLRTHNAALLAVARAAKEVTKRLKHDELATSPLWIESFLNEALVALEPLGIKVSP